MILWKGTIVKYHSIKAESSRFFFNFFYYLFGEGGNLGVPVKSMAACLIWNHSHCQRVGNFGKILICQFGEFFKGSKIKFNVCTLMILNIQIAKFKSYQYQLRATSPNLKLP